MFYKDGKLITAQFPTITSKTFEQFQALPTDGTADGFYDIDGGAGEIIAPTELTYAEWLALPEAQRNTGNYIITGLTPHNNAYNITYKNNVSVGQELDTLATSIGDLDSAKQPKNLSSSIAGETTVEGCLTKLNADKIDKLTLRKSGTNGTSCASQIAELYTVYQTLTLDEKLRSVIVSSDNLEMHHVGLTNGQYFAGGISSTDLTCYSVNLQYSLFRSINIQAGTSTTIITNLSDQIPPIPFKLYA